MNKLIPIGDSLLINPSAIAHIQKFADGTIRITFLGNNDPKFTIKGAEAAKFWEHLSQGQGALGRAKSLAGI